MQAGGRGLTWQENFRGNAQGVIRSLAKTGKGSIAMAYDAGLFELMRTDLAGQPVVERKMFGGIAFLLHGHMVCGLHKGGAMYRVGKANDAAARAIPGTGPMEFTGRPMTGMLSVDDGLMADDARRATLTAMALAHAASLPPK